jgi:hypothetical protein
MQRHRNKAKNFGKTKRVNKTDLSAKCFLFVGNPKDTKTWLLPVFDPTSAAKSKQNIATNLFHFDQVAKGIPQAQHRALRAQLEGAAQSHGLNLPSSDDVAVSDDEMLMMLAERAATRVLNDMSTLYDW